MTATTTAAGRGSAWRAAVRPMPALVAAAYLALLLVSVVVMVLALAAELIGELAERLAVAGWAGASAIHSAYRPAAGSPSPPAGGGPGRRVDDPAVRRTWEAAS